MLNAMESELHLAKVGLARRAITGLGAQKKPMLRIGLWGERSDKTGRPSNSTQASALRFYGSVRK